MHQIGYYYADNGVFHLYNTDFRMGNWVSNICYYDTLLGKYYSPNIKNVMLYGRDLHMGRFSVTALQAEISTTHSSFVLN